jgi:hypothetical protein
MSSQHHVSAILPRGKNPSTHWTKDWMDPVKKKKKKNIFSMSSTLQPADNQGRFSAVADIRLSIEWLYDSK